MQSTKCRTSVISTTCCVILWLLCVSSVGCTVVDLSCLFHVSSVSKWSVHIFDGARISNSLELVCYRVMGSCNPSLVNCLISCVVRSPPSLSPSAFITSHVIAILSFPHVCIGYMQDEMKPNIFLSVIVLDNRIAVLDAGMTYGRDFAIQTPREGVHVLTI